MNSISHKRDLGTGIYTVADISRLLGFPQSKVRRYLADYWDERLGRKLFSDSYTWSAEKSKTKAVNFYVLIELFTFFRLQELGVTTHKILKARDHIAKEIGVTYPFASAGLLTNGKKIWYEFEESLVNADGSRQTNFIEIVKSFADKIDFRKDKLAERFYPAGRDQSIVVDPHHQFGQPIIKGTNINTDVIFSMYKSGEPIESIGIIYDVTEKEVEDIINFYSKAA
jgi:uncharacterized protein (DUF433 family)